MSLTTVIFRNPIIFLMIDDLYKLVTYLWRMSLVLRHSFSSLHSIDFLSHIFFYRILNYFLYILLRIDITIYPEEIFIFSYNNNIFAIQYIYPFSIHFRQHISIRSLITATVYFKEKKKERSIISLLSCI